LSTRVFACAIALSLIEPMVEAFGTYVAFASPSVFMRGIGTPDTGAVRRLLAASATHSDDAHELS
jgi:hypothetical protein